MKLSSTVLSILAVAGVVLSLLALAVAVALSARARKGRSRRPPIPQEELAGLVEAQARAIKRLENAVRTLAGGERKLAEMLEVAVQHVGVIRFDAFEDMGGRLSFSAALLDAHGDGVVITSINGRQETRCYAKQVQAGTSIHNLSDEEEQAIREAIGSARQTLEAS